MQVRPLKNGLSLLNENYESKCYVNSVVIPSDYEIISTIASTKIVIFFNENI